MPPKPQLRRRQPPPPLPPPPEKPSPSPTTLSAQRKLRERKTKGPKAAEATAPTIVTEATSTTTTSSNTPDSGKNKRGRAAAPAATARTTSSPSPTAAAAVTATSSNTPGSSGSSLKKRGRVAATVTTTISSPSPPTAAASSSASKIPSSSSSSSCRNKRSRAAPTTSSPTPPPQRASATPAGQRKKIQHPRSSSGGGGSSIHHGPPSTPSSSSKPMVQVQEKLCKILKQASTITAATSKEHDKAVNTMHYVDSFIALYNEISNDAEKATALLEELRFRLNLLAAVNKPSQLEGKATCLLVVCGAALRLLIDEGKPRLLLYLLDVCRKSNRSDDAEIRLFTCQLAAALLKSSKFTGRELPLADYDALAELLAERWLDESPSVRKEAIRSLAVLDEHANSKHVVRRISTMTLRDSDVDARDEVNEGNASDKRTPREMLLRSLYDQAEECREEALVHIGLIGKHYQQPPPHHPNECSLISSSPSSYPSAPLLSSTPSASTSTTAVVDSTMTMDSVPSKTSGGYQFEQLLGPMMAFVVNEPSGHLKNAGLEKLAALEVGEFIVSASGAQQQAGAPAETGLHQQRLVALKNQLARLLEHLLGLAEQQPESLEAFLKSLVAGRSTGAEGSLIRAGGSSQQQQLGETSEAYLSDDEDEEDIGGGGGGGEGYTGAGLVRSRNSGGGGVKGRMATANSMMEGLFHLVDFLGHETNHELCKRLLHRYFTMFASGHPLDGMCGHLRRLQLPPVHTFQPARWLCHENYRRLLDPLLSWHERHLLAFIWRQLIAYCCSEYKRREDRKSLCLFKLAPTLAAMVQFTSEFIYATYKSSEALSDDDDDDGDAEDRFGEIGAPQNEERNSEDKSKVLLHLFGVLTHLEREPVGMRQWSELLFSTLTNISVPLGEKGQLCHAICQCLMQVHFPSAEDVQEAIHELCDTINALGSLPNNCNNMRPADMESILGGGAASSRRSATPSLLLPTLQQQQQQQASTSMSTTMMGEQMGVGATVTMDESTRHRALVIFNAMLRTGRFREPSVELQGLSDSIINEALSSLSPHQRALAAECTGVVCTWEEGFARDNANIFSQLLAIDVAEVKRVVIGVLTHLVVQYGYEPMCQWYQMDPTAIDTAEAAIPSSRSSSRSPRLSLGRGESQGQLSLDGTSLELFEQGQQGQRRRLQQQQQEGEQPWDKELLINQLLAFTEDKDAELAFAATEALCKWCLLARGPTTATATGTNNSNGWQRVLLHLMTQLVVATSHHQQQSAKQQKQVKVSSSSREDAKMMACLANFLSIYASLGVENQRNLIDTMMDSLDTLKDSTNSANVNESELASLVVDLTAPHIIMVAIPSQLTSTASSTETAHSYFAGLLLERLRNNVHSFYAPLFCQVLASLEVEEPAPTFVGGEEEEEGNFSLHHLLRERVDGRLQHGEEVAAALEEGTRERRNVLAFVKRLTKYRERLVRSRGGLSPSGMGGGTRLGMRETQSTQMSGRRKKHQPTAASMGKQHFPQNTEALSALISQLSCASPRRGTISFASTRHNAATHSSVVILGSARKRGNKNTSITVPTTSTAAGGPSSITNSARKKRTGFTPLARRSQRFRPILERSAKKKRMGDGGQGPYHYYNFGDTTIFEEEEEGEVEDDKVEEEESTRGGGAPPGTNAAKEQMGDEIRKPEEENQGDEEMLGEENNTTNTD